MNRIILIGNGFDLAHNLHTSYKHFIDDYWNQKSELLLKMFDSRITANGNIRRIREFEDDDIIIRNLGHISYFSLSDVSDKCGYQRFKYLYDQLPKEPESSTGLLRVTSRDLNMDIKNKFLEQITEKQLWVDIEHEYYKAMIECLEEKTECKWEGGIEQLNKEFSVIQKALEKYLVEEVKKKNISLFQEIRDKLFIKKTDYGTAQIDDNTLFLNFNYTPIGRLYSDYKKSNKIIYIHGELDNPENPMIFGYGGDLGNNSEKIDEKNDGRYKENIKRLKYKNVGNYDELLNFLKNGKFEIIIMGLSCGISDRTLLNKLFEHDNCDSIKIFFHQWKDDSGNIHDDYNYISSNIDSCFNKKDLFDARVKIKKSCEPLPQLPKPD
jgi:hypothetical protein